MKRIRNCLKIVALCAGVAAFALRAASDLQMQAKQAISDFKSADTSINQFFTNSAGYAVFPNVGKGGFVVGGARGKGVVFQNGRPIGEAVMTQATIGAQAGGQSFAQVIFFQTPHALEDFKTGKFEMAADVSAVAAKEGVSKSAKYKDGVAVFTLPKKGLMAQASVGGQRFKYEPLNLEPTGRSESTTNQ